MKNFSTLFLIFFLCSCGGGSQGGGAGTSTSETQPSEAESSGPKLEPEVRLVKSLWSDLHEDPASVWFSKDHSDETRLQKGMALGFLLSRGKYDVSFEKASLVIEAFVQASKLGMVPDFKKLATLTIKVNEHENDN